MKDSQEPYRGQNSLTKQVYEKSTARCIYIQRDIYICLPKDLNKQKKFIEALFLRVPNCKKTTYFSSGESTNKLCHIHPVEDYTPTIINELQIFTLLNVTIIM